MLNRKGIFYFTLSIILLSLILTSCKGKNTGAKNADTSDFIIANNSEMAADTKADIGKMTAAFEKSLSSGDAAGIMGFIDKDFKVTKAQLDTFFQERKKNKTNPFVKFDEYYMKGLTVGQSVVKIKKEKSSENYIEITPGSTEMYAATYASDNQKISFMVTLVCAKINKAWKIVWIDISDYKYNGKTAKDLYKIAQNLEKSKKLLPSYIYAEMMFNVIQPGKIMKYGNFSEMEDFYYKIQSEVWKSKALPFTLDALKNVKIHVVGLSNQEKEGIIPLIMYQTNTPVSNAAARTAEGKRVMDEMDKLYPGLKSNFSYIAFNVTNQDPTNQKVKVNLESMVLPTK